MAGNFRINVHLANGNLHLRPNGSLDHGSAWELINLIHSQYSGQGRVFVDTKGLTEILPGGVQVLKHNLDNRLVPYERLFFKGEKGYGLAPSGCRVLVPSGFSGCRCGSNCQNCARRHDAKDAADLEREIHEC